MHAIYRYADIQETLKNNFERRHNRRDVNITGILIARPETPTTKEEIIPHLNYWHYRSDVYTEFFCVGYTPHNSSDILQTKPLARVENGGWYFSDQAFTEVVDEIERQTNWHYNSRTYLIITNSRYDRVSGKACLDFSGAMVVDIANAIKDESISSASELADALFGFAKRINEDVNDPVWEFSDSQGLHVLRKSLKHYLLKLLPESLQQPTRQAIHFVARDIQAVQR